MENRSEGTAVAVAIGLVLILLLAAGGVGIYLFIGRQADRARLAEEEARMQAELARAELARAELARAELVRAEAEVAAASRRNAPEKEPPSVQGDSIHAAVESVLRAQADAWNRGDLDAFMEHYAKSESLTFSPSGKTTRGWNETLKRYRQRYPTPEKMGRVKFAGLEITPLGDSAALVLGQWQVDRQIEPLSGNFSLVLRKIDDRWLIVHDHTSRLTE